MEGYYQSSLNFLVPSGNLISAGSSYIFSLSTYLGSSIDGLPTTAVGTPNKIWLNTPTERGYAELLYQPVPQTLTIRNFNPGISATTILDLQFTINVDLVSGDYIEVSFPTTNLQTTLFELDLEGTEPGLLSKVLDCSEYGTNTLLSNSKLECEVVLGKRTAVPSVHSRLLISITKAING